MILKYTQYISEKVVYELLLESKLVISKRLMNLLFKMRSNKIASDLISLYSKDVDIQHNYIDITDEKDAVSFTPDRKVKELMEGKPQHWKVISQSNLTHNDSNDAIFERLGYDKTKFETSWRPERGTIGTILNETVSTSSGNIYVLFQDISERTLVSEPKLSVINKKGLEEVDSDDNKIWSTSRNPIKIGRLVRAILNSVKITFTDKDIEDFTNQYKATYDFAKDALRQFNIVKGRKISYWYNQDNYVTGGGTLNSSCMADVDRSYFEIYDENIQISLVILYSEDGKIDGDKYSADQIKGRAILWDAKVDGVPAKFMDRVYTRNDSDVDLFKQFAEKNGWFYKKTQSMDPEEEITDGLSTRARKIVVELKYTDFEYYPYCDTMCYLDMDMGKISNVRNDVNEIRELRDTSGGFE